MSARRRSGARLGALLAAASLFPAGCALHAPRDPEPARVALEVTRGFARLPSGAPPALPRVELLVDFTTSMRARTAGGPTRAAAARSAAVELLHSLPQGSEITLRSMGHAAGAGQCAPAERLIGPAIPANRQPFAHRLRDLAPRSESSLAEAFAELGRELADTPRARRTRVVAFTDLEDPCGGDVCAAASALVAAGAWLEVVALGDEPTPACLSALRPSAAAPGPTAALLTPPPPAFRVEAGAAAARDPWRPLVAGRAGDAPVEVRPGLVTLFVDLDPPEEIGPFRLAPGEAARVRLLDFPGADPPVRTWRVERGDEPVGRTFPPPATLPPVTP